VQVLAHIDRLGHIVSTYDPQSEVVRWMAGERAANVSPELYELLLLCDQYEQQTNGAFNPRVGAVMTLWKKAATEGSRSNKPRPHHQSIRCANYNR
jgi:thiamine biosynthesis lipoprotein ApbE